MIESPGLDGKYRVVVNIPTMAFVPWEFAFDLANMLAYTTAGVGDKVALFTNVVPGTYVHRAREQLLDRSHELGSHYMLWLDSDMRFPKDLLIRLMQHDKHMVGINYSTRGIPPRFVAIKKIARDHDGAGELIETNEDSTGLEQAEAIGFGAVLMKSVITEKLEFPRFFFENYDEGAGHVGEDVWFCRKVREQGWEIFVDHDLSKECAHVGQMEYRVQHAEAHLVSETEGSDGNIDLQRVADSDCELVQP